MTLVEFLEARIAEDERKAEAGGYHNGGGVFANDNYGCLLVQPSRVLAECAAKRAIISDHQQVDVPFFWPVCVGCERQMPCATLRHLAAVYKDHPDYREEWSSAT